MSLTLLVRLAITKSIIFRTGLPSGCDRPSENHVDRCCIRCLNNVLHKTRLLFSQSSTNRSPFSFVERRSDKHATAPFSPGEEHPTLALKSTNSHKKSRLLAELTASVKDE